MRYLVLMAALACATASPASSQERLSPPAQQRLEQMAQRSPAARLLAARQELALTPRQVAALQQAQRAFQARAHELMQVVDGQRQAQVREQRGGEAARGAAPEEVRRRRERARNAGIELRRAEREAADAARALLTDAQRRRADEILGGTAG